MAINDGWPRINFVDAYDTPCYVQVSSIVGDYPDAEDRPGTSALWLGVQGVQAQVMARDAAKVGVQTEKTTGWVDFPIPPQVLITRQMHLNREQVAALRDRLTEWLDACEHGTDVPWPPNI